MNNLPDESIVLLAILEIKGYMTRNEVEQRAKKLTNASDNIVYEGPRPNFNENDIFESAWDNLLQSGYLVKSESGKYDQARFLANTNKNAIRTLCDGKDEEKSINSIIR